MLRFDPMKPAPILAASGISRRVDDGRWLLYDVSLEVAAGERWAIIGPTGSGKSLLLRALALLDQVDEGRVLWQGQEVQSDVVPEFRRQVIYLHQRPVLVEDSVERNLQLPYILRGCAKEKFDRNRIIERLCVLGRGAEFLEKQSRDLSGGEAQIVALLRAVQLNPSVLLLDEPTAALDAEAGTAIEILVGRWLSETGDARAAVWVSHNAEQINRVADKTLRLEQGRIRECSNDR